MNWAHVHLLLNHVPVVGVGMGIVLLALGMAKRSEDLKQVSIGIFAALSFFIIPVYLTGSPTATLLKSIPGVSSAMIHQHSDAALVSTIALEILGLVSMGLLFLTHRGRAVPAWLEFTVLFLALGVQGLMVWTANLGGEIRHPEIRPLAASAATSAGKRSHSHGLSAGSSRPSCSASAAQNPLIRGGA